MTNIAIFSEIQAASSLKFLPPSHGKLSYAQERSVGSESGPQGYDAQVKNTCTNWGAKQTWRVCYDCLVASPTGLHIEFFGT